MSSAFPFSLKPISILAVIVVYKQVPEQSSSLKSLLMAKQNNIPTDVRLTILVADNTPGGQVIALKPDVFRYRAYPDNPGLARPYNDALRTAEEEQFEWLLTLDQDTSLPQDFLAGMVRGLRTFGTDEEVAAVVPRIHDGGKFISPFRFKGGFLPVVTPERASGVLGPHTSALNSASLLKVKATRAIGGYDEHFPLHNSDTRFYQKLDRAGKRVALVADILVAHEFSILDRAGRMSPERYQQMLIDECTFWDRHMSFAARFERVVRLLGRYGSGFLRGEQPVFQNVTRMEICRRIFQSRKSRQQDRLKHLEAKVLETQHRCGLVDNG
ncbi:MAG: hypothetical protein ACRYGF_18410 [Janthinobacterium lividum]